MSPKQTPRGEVIHHTSEVAGGRATLGTWSACPSSLLSQMYTDLWVSQQCWCLSLKEHTSRDQGTHREGNRVA